MHKNTVVVKVNTTKKGKDFLCTPRAVYFLFLLKRIYALNSLLKKFSLLNYFIISQVILVLSH